MSMLDMREHVALDRSPIEEMCRSLGVEKAERLVGGAMEELAVWISRADPMWRQGRIEELRQLAGQVAPLAERLGMPNLAAVAAQLVALCARDDPAALAAVASRMIRLGESSLVAIWELQNLSG
ncbi:hypothetical protein [Frigidibacter sp. ROC022]|uniref:hypothetical protein n=1 Tax=Frigidibacter sp. ROC022 TaxID=2971796 RepID=UPI00215A3C66|nr:hypothetical protein [Frigidibacter sp. ROC022]MCR8724228.1 hypothetical protein [Frigidibacter sp. ROC022]